LANIGCTHCPGSHTGALPCLASATTKARSWLLVEHPGPWAERIEEMTLPEPIGAVLAEADRLGVRPQLIRRAGRRRATPPLQVFVAWSGPSFWLEGRELADPAELADLDLAAVATGRSPGLSSVESDPARAFRARLRHDHRSHPHRVESDPAKPCSHPHRVESDPAKPCSHPHRVESDPAKPCSHPHLPLADRLLLVCAHGRRNACCARTGAPLARALTDRFGDAVWETTHVGGDRFAANLVCLPHGLYYGNLGIEDGIAAATGYDAGEVRLDHYRGRAGLSEPAQAAEHFLRSATGAVGIDEIIVESVRTSPAISNVSEAIVRHDPSPTRGEGRSRYRVGVRQNRADPCGPGCAESLGTYVLTDLTLLNEAALV
jgi:Sucrase/ferredoxin-like